LCADDIESCHLIIHRLAYLLRLRNVTAATVAYHLRNMERENVVVHHPKGKGWKLTPVQQTQLSEFLKKRKSRRKKKG